MLCCAIIMFVSKVGRIRWVIYLYCTVKILRNKVSTFVIIRFTVYFIRYTYLTQPRFVTIKTLRFNSWNSLAAELHQTWDDFLVFRTQLLRMKVWYHQNLRYVFYVCFIRLLKYSNLENEFCGIVLYYIMEKLNLKLLNQWSFAPSYSNIFLWLFVQTSLRLSHADFQIQHVYHL